MILRGEFRTIVDTRPFLLLPVPPDQLLPLTPRRSIWTRRSAVIQDAAVRRPCKPPAVAVPPVGRAATGLVLSRLWKHPGVNPASTRCGAVCLQFSEPADQLAV